MNGQMELPVGAKTWGSLDIALPLPGSFKDVFTGAAFDHSDDAGNRKLRVSDVLGQLPLAVLVRQ
jgi:maltooligosyltrehalose synthase